MNDSQTLTEQVKNLRAGQRVRVEYESGATSWASEGVLAAPSANRLWITGSGADVRDAHGTASSFLTSVTVLDDPLPTEPGSVIKATVTRDGVSVVDVVLLLTDDPDNCWRSATLIRHYRWHRAEHLSNIKVGRIVFGDES
jgi:hypothetical protein